MARKKPAGPGSFCEWVIGTTIESALGPIPKRPPRRDVLRLELSTDDESETDRIKITYPRTRNSSSPKQTEVRVKKVRFEDGHPRKSALKKAEAVVSESDDEPTSDSETDASAEETSEQSSEEEENLPAKPQKSKKNKRKKMKKRPETAKTAESTESDEDSEPHPTCKCTRCIQGRQKAKRQKKAKNKKDQASLSDGPCENEKPRKSKKSKTKKTKDMSESSETDTDATDTSAESEKEQSEEGQVVKKPKQKTQDDKAKPRAKEKEKKLAYNSQAEETKEDAAQLSDTSPKNKNKKGNYPEASPLPHPRRPHYIEPVRAEVVQTERVIETPQDPPPNAFYDAEHNIVRVYHGPIWGANPNHSLYPRRDASLRPLPIGVPHPTQNPYYYGFASVAQPPAEKPGIAPNQQDGPAQSAPEVPEGGCNGAWSNFAKNHGPPSSKDKDAGGLDNISPQTHRAVSALAGEILVHTLIPTNRVTQIRITRRQSCYSLRQEANREDETKQPTAMLLVTLGVEKATQAPRAHKGLEVTRDVKTTTATKHAKQTIGTTAPAGTMKVKVLGEQMGIPAAARTFKPAAGGTRGPQITRPTACRMAVPTPHMKNGQEQRTTMWDLMKLCRGNILAITSGEIRVWLRTLAALFRAARNRLQPGGK
jgi:hypothetical protein